MIYVTLQVPEHLYLPALAFLAAADDEHHASAELVKDNQILHAVVETQTEEIGRLRTLLDEAVHGSEGRTFAPYSELGPWAQDGVPLP